MAYRWGSEQPRDLEGSLVIDSILSQEEAKDIVSMMIMADEHEGLNRLPSFCTSTQMGGKDQRRRPESPQLSPLGSPGPSNLAELGAFNDEHVGTTKGEELRSMSNEVHKPSKVAFLNLKNSFDILEVSYGGRNEGEIPGKLPRSEPWMSNNSPGERGRRECRDVSGVVATDRGVTMESNQEPIEDVNVGGGGNGGSADRVDTDGESEGAISGGGESVTDPEPQSDSSDGKYQANLQELTTKMGTIDEFMERIDKRSLSLTNTVKDLEDSLSFSQRQIDDLKKENAELKKQVGEIEMEDRRTQFQVTSVEGKLDKLETSMKKKNLLFEGIPEVQNRNEEVARSVEALFDQISVARGIDFEACYRVGPYDKNKTRPILVTFEKQSDRDMIYTRRFDLKRTKDFQRVWVNEDMGPLSKRKRSLIKLITKEAQAQGVDCRSGKYSLTIDKKKFDEENLEDLPPKLNPTQLKQVQIDEKTLAYQSEFAPFSNFFHCTVVVGSHKFFCLEQAYQFLRAKILEKPLTATRIYLSRDVYYIKQLGFELGTSEKWDARKFDVMYECLKKKFDQHPELKALLLKTGDLELVEATPDRLWGCGATLSSNILRRHAWPGQNKHGKILMTIREEYRRLAAK